MYATLRSGWQCGCQGHTVNLRLENRSKKREREEDVLEQTPFHVIFSYSLDSSTPTPINSIGKETDIRYIDDKPANHTPLPLSTTSAAAIPTTKRRVRFDLDEPQIQQTSLPTTMTTPGPPYVYSTTMGSLFSEGGSDENFSRQPATDTARQIQARRRPSLQRSAAIQNALARWTVGERLSLKLGNGIQKL
ncbi:hypothetical protein K505DRAFT_422491 [Melanomma pulvis-pyrius CBS 109.77]|uniref:Uncharacterized protein n=1 Tax=Melanomma pulvis-pyrius CBS 109.77 TaxID=1314802 RepID=A0A6A6WQH3_9PLEO|nr:hypothetical protein K505DRAFT_422491 [Melanomma pulvis-pyrius CBS 109.77]